MRFFTAISALFLGAMLSDSPSARAAFLQCAGRLLGSQGTTCVTAAHQQRPRASFRFSFLQSPRFLAAAAKPGGLERPPAALRVATAWPIAHALALELRGASLHAPQRSGSPPLC